jgi:signal transduction histidine kinase
MTPMTVQPATQAPAPHDADGAENRRLWTSVLLVLAGWITVRPLGLRGEDLVVLLLLAVTSLFQLGRHLPAARAQSRYVLPLLVCWMLAVCALLVLRSQTVAPMYAFLFTGYAGYRLRLRTALAFAVSAGVLCATGLRLGQLHHLETWPWLLGLTVALPVFLGMSNRSRDQAVNSAIEAARSAQRAAEAESREQALTERARISRDIHDVLAHSLTGVSMQLELSEMLLEGGEVDQARASISKAHSMVREGMAEARRAVTAMRSETLPLRQTLEAQFAGAGQVRVEGTAVELPTEAAQAVVRTAQEALTNARRHAPGAPVEVTLRYSRSEVQLQVDNGPAVGGASARTGSGMGLIGMRERAALLGGSAEAGPLADGTTTSSALAGGWRVLLRLPVEPPHRAAVVGRTSTSQESR